MYRTVQGDTWDVISLKVFGSTQYISLLMDANRAYIETVIFLSGVELNVPEVSVKRSTKLPPWKR